MNPEILKHWTAKLQPLVGRKIIAVRYMTAAEQQHVGWHRSPVVLQLDDGTLLFPQSDDEGNDAGALAIQTGRQTKYCPELAPVI